MKAREQLFYKVIVTDKNGKVVAVQEAKAHSFLKQYNQLLSAQMGDANRTIKNTSGVDQTVSPATYSFDCNATAGQTNPVDSVHFGIRVGTGNTAVTISDYALETPAAEGIGDGQVEHLITTLAVPSVSDPDCTFTITRVMDNKGSTTITVTEIGIYCGCYYSGGEGTTCIVRDILGSSVAVPAGGAITVIYTWKITE